MGNPAAAPIPFQTVLTNQNAVFLGFGEAWGRPCIPATNRISGQPLRWLAGGSSFSGFL